MYVNMRRLCTTGKWNRQQARVDTTVLYHLYISKRTTVLVVPVVTYLPTGLFVCLFVCYNLLTTCLDPQAHIDEAIYPVSCVYQTISIHRCQLQPAICIRKVHKLDNFNGNM